MKQLVKDTKRDAPVNSQSRGSHYRGQIASKKLTSTTHKHSYLWYVKGDKYRLAHLLNNGHATRNGGRVEGDEHITRNALRVMADYEKSVKEVIEHGS
ncbi:MAG: hypothetical protein PHC95_04930 [Parabacteroides sp.]|nr:hypothetical protein [Parabacteroides sp.]